MKNLVIILALLNVLSVKAQSTWEKVSLTEKVSISFPARPVEATAGAGQKTFLLNSADSTANFMVAVTDVGVLMGVDSATLAAEMENEAFWEQAKAAFTNGMGAGASLVKDEIIEIKNVIAMKMVIDRKNQAGGVNKLTVVILIHGTNSFNIIFNNRDGKADQLLAQKFIDSIEIH